MKFFQSFVNNATLSVIRLANTNTGNEAILMSIDNIYLHAQMRKISLNILR